MTNLPKTLLIIDDDRLYCDVLRDDLSGPGLEVLLAHSGGEGVHVCSQRKVDVVLLDQKLPDGAGVSFCPAILGHGERAKIIFATAFPEFSNAVEAIKAGAYDYLSKPFELDELRLVIERALRAHDLERAGELQSYRHDRESRAARFAGHNGGLAEVDRLVTLAAAERAPVLITGETGTGKNVVASAIHYRSGLREAPLISINCAALPENLVETELFGHEKGAFTGAGAARKGLFEMADGGTLFLDEIGEMPLHLQTKLLGVLEEKKVRRLGGGAVRPVEVRVIAATNLDLRRALEQKLFREDLYYRLNVLHIDLPPLRERPQDIPELCEHFIRQCARGRQVRLPSAELDQLLAYPWPGNVRELKNILERAVILGRDGQLAPSRLLQAGQAAGEPPAELPAQIQPLEELEKAHIRLALQQLSGNYTRTARALGIGLSTLKRKVKRYGLG